MKKHYDFSKGEKGKFYVPEDEMELPIYLNQSNQKYYLDLAISKNTTMSKLINSILSKDKEILNLILAD